MYVAIDLILFGSAILSFEKGKPIETENKVRKIADRHLENEKHEFDKYEIVQTVRKREIKFGLYNRLNILALILMYFCAISLTYFCVKFGYFCAKLA